MPAFMYLTITFSAIICFWCSLSSALKHFFYLLISAIVDCWGVMWQFANLHRTSMGLQQATICCTGYEHFHVEQPFHRKTSHVNWRAWNFSHPPCHKETSLWGLWEWCNGRTFSNPLDYKTILGVTASTKWLKRGLVRHEQ